MSKVMTRVGPHFAKCALASFGLMLVIQLAAFAEVNNQTCVPITVQFCPSLGGAMCQNSYEGCKGWCPNCYGGGALPVKVCVPLEGSDCPQAGNPIDCGPRRVGKCNQKEGASCGCTDNGQPNGNCGGVMGC